MQIHGSLDTKIENWKNQQVLEEENHDVSYPLNKLTVCDVGEDIVTGFNLFFLYIALVAELGPVI